jgi:hypothetical protein
VANFNSGLAFGSVARGITRVMEQKHQEEYDEKRQKLQLLGNLVSAGLQSGTVKNPDEAIKFLFEQGKTGKGGKDVPPQISNLFGAIKQRAQQGGGDTTLGGQQKPSFGGPQQQPQQGGGGMPQFMSGEEMDRAKEQSTLRLRRGEGQIASDQAGATTQAQLEAKDRIAKRWMAQGMPENEAYERAGLKQPVPKAAQAERDVQPDKSSPTGWVRRYLGPDGSVVRTEPAPPPPSQVAKEGSLTKRIQDAMAQNPNMSATDKRKLVDKETAEYQRLHGGLSFQEKLALAKEKAIIIQGIKDARVGDVTNNAQSVTVGGESRGYVNLGDYSASEKDKAREDALKNGLTPLQPKEAEKVQDSANALENAQGMLDQIKGSLPESYQNRPWAALRNLTFKEIQADDALASYQAWGVATMPIVRSLGAMGRITNLELNQAKDALPKMTDTVGVAAEKTQILSGMLERGMKRVLNRGKGKGDKAAGGGGSDSQAAIRTKARQHLLDAQKQGKIPTTVMIDEAAVDKWLKANPTFK